MNPVYIYDAIRTPRARAKEGGGLNALTPFDLMRTLYEAIEERNQLDKNHVDDVVLGCVTQVVEQAANIAKSSLMYAQWPDHIPGITVNRYCSSGLDAVNIAALKIAAGQAEVTLAGGVEMMSRMPMLSDKASVFSDIQLATRCRMLMMGSGADLIASQYGLSREQVDEVALQSQQRAAHAQKEGYFKSIIGVQNGDKVISEDECIRPQTTMQSLASLEPSFAELGAKGVDGLQLSLNQDLQEINHVHTAGNSPAMADGAALCLLADNSLQKQGLKARARIVDATSACDDHLTVISGCIKATEKLLQRQNKSADDIDLFEIHEAFAATSIKCQQDLNICNDKLNVNGGVIALGHPLGATGAMMLGTLLDEMERRDFKTGVVAASGAAGTGTALMIERG